MKKNKKLNIKGNEIIFFQESEEDYISLTDIAKYKNPETTGIIISNWLSRRYSIEFMGVWEKIHNRDFNVIEFDNIKNESGSNAFILSKLLKKSFVQLNQIKIISKKRLERNFDIKISSQEFYQIKNRLQNKVLKPRLNDKNHSIVDRSS